MQGAEASPEILKNFLRKKFKEKHKGHVTLHLCSSLFSLLLLLLVIIIVIIAIMVGVTLSLSHTLSCRKGGLVIQRHNEIRDTFGDLAALAWSQVKKEPVVNKPSSSNPALIADLAVRGVWSPQVDVFDIRVTDTDASSYGDQTPMAILKRAKAEKKEKYLKACEEKMALFTSLCYCGGYVRTRGFPFP